MSSSNSPTMQRSVSMPAQPEPLQTKPMKRSQEKETLVEEDYYPESPSSERRNKSLTDTRDHLGSGSQSANNFLTTEWAGSTIELNSDLRRNEVDTFYYRRKPYRVIEKNGRENVSFKKIPEKSWRYIRDFVTTLVRWILPQRFLTYTTTTTTTSSSSSTITVNNTTQIPFKCDDEKLTSDSQILKDTVQITENNKDRDGENNKISEVNAISDNDEVESSSINNKRVIFSLYD